MQNIEFNRMMGVEHFYIYVQSASAKVMALLEYYKKKDLITILYVPEKPTSRAWYNSQVMLNNDCHLRARYTSQYIAIVDPDEFIVPLRHNSWLELVEHLERQPQNSSLPVAHYSFRHAFYGSPEMNSSVWAQVKSNLSLTSGDEKFIRELHVFLYLGMYRTRFYDYPSRAKSIYKPGLVLESGTHTPEKIAAGSRGLSVPTELAILQHHNHRHRDSTNCFLDIHLLPFHRQYLQRLRVVGSSLPNISDSALCTDLPNICPSPKPGLQ